MGKLTTGLRGALLPGAIVFCCAALFLWNPLPLQTLRHFGFDQYQRQHPRTDPASAVVIIDIDESSLKRFGQWPWPRDLLARLLSALESRQAAAIGFDVVFAEADRTSPRQLLAHGELPASLQKPLAALPDHDEVFSTAIGRGKVVLGFAIDPAGPPPEIKARYVAQGAAPEESLHHFGGAVSPLPAFRAAASGLGAITFIPDGDGVVRRVPLLVNVGGVVAPGLATELLRVAQGAKNIITFAEDEAHAGLSAVQIGTDRIPVTPRGEVWVHYGKSGQTHYIPAWKVLAGEVPASQLAGRIVLVGTSAQGLMDLRFSPLGEVIPGVEVHAQFLEQVLRGNSLLRPAWAESVELLVFLIGGLSVGLAALYLRTIWSASVFVVLALACGWAALQAFAAGFLIDALTPILALALTFTLTSLYRHLIDEKRERWLRQAFSRYVSPNLVSYLIKRPDALDLGGKRRECSFVFTDLAGFTRLMESLDPGKTVSILNEYLEGMVSIAFAHQGTLDRIVGDAVAILFSAPIPQPDHARRALNCALEMQRFSAAFSARLNAAGIAFGHTRIGVHSGEVIVGNFGGRAIFDYRALGDAVNTAARLESANKLFGTEICVSGPTLAACPGQLARPVGMILLLGKTQPIAVYEPLLEAQEDKDYLAAYQLLDTPSQALPAFEQLARVRPDDRLVAFHLSRLQAGEQGSLIQQTRK